MDKAKKHKRYNTGHRLYYAAPNEPLWNTPHPPRVTSLHCKADGSRTKAIQKHCHQCTKCLPPRCCKWAYLVDSPVHSHTQRKLELALLDQLGIQVAAHESNIIFQVAGFNNSNCFWCALIYHFASNVVASPRL